MSRHNIDGVIGELDSLPGCSQIAVSHAVFVPPANRGTGLGSLAHKKRLLLCKELGYDVVMCTANMENTPQISILNKNRWVKLQEFRSSKTGNIVGIFTKTMEDVV